MGNIYTGSSKERLLKIQDTILNKVETAYNKRHSQATVKFSTWQTSYSPISLNVIKCVSSKVNNSDKPIVFVHGYGAGGVLFANNMAGLAYSLNRPVYSVDWTGFGASTRLEYHGSSTKDALNYFIKPFEDWRKQNGIEKMDLVGHSLGGYLAGKYCLNYNGEQVVDNLILASPVGIPHMPAPDPDKKVPIVFKTLRKLWSMGATMSGFIRLLGHYPGHALMGWAAKKRFDGGQTLGLEGEFVSDEDQQLCVDYLHQLFAAKGSGEAAAAKHILQPGAYAFEPLIDEVDGFKSSNVMFIYGDRDWMSIRAGAEAAKKIDAKLRTDVVQIEGTHHLYLDSPDQFNNAVAKFLNK